MAIEYTLLSSLFCIVHWQLLVTMAIITVTLQKAKVLHILLAKYLDMKLSLESAFLQLSLAQLHGVQKMGDRRLDDFSG